MGLRRPGAVREYEEMPGANVPLPTKNLHPQHHQILRGGLHHGDITSHPIASGLEMSSVSVVPDGTDKHVKTILASNFLNI